MPQNALPYNPAISPGGTPKPLNLDSGGNLKVASASALSALNVTAAEVVATPATRLAKIVVVDPGTTGGAFTINDCATTGAASAANTIWSVPYNGTGVVKGAVFTLDWPITIGIVVSAVPSGGTPILAISYT